MTQLPTNPATTLVRTPNLANAALSDVIMVHLPAPIAGDYEYLLAKAPWPLLVLGASVKTLYGTCDCQLLINDLEPGIYVEVGNSHGLVNSNGSWRATDGAFADYDAPGTTMTTGADGNYVETGQPLKFKILDLVSTTIEDLFLQVLVQRYRAVQ